MQDFCDLVHASTNTLIWCKTYEPERFIGDLSSIVIKNPEMFGKNINILQIFLWDAASGLSVWNITDNKTSASQPIKNFVSCETEDQQLYKKTINPAGMLKYIDESQRKSCNKNRLFILKNFHLVNRPSGAPNVVQGLLNLRELSQQKLPVILLSPVVDIPIEEEKLFTVFEYELPDEEEIRSVIDRAAKVVNERNKVDGNPELTEETITECVEASKGLTYYEVNDCCCKSLVKYETLNPKVFRDEKIEIVRKSGYLDFKETTESTFEDMGGNEEFKKWIIEEKELFGKEAAEFGLERPKGFICFGPAGAGKTASAEMTASLFGVPLLILNFSKIMGSLVGQSERAIDAALSVVKAVAPCVLLLDETEKILGG